MAGGIHSFFDLADGLLDTIGAPPAPSRRSSRSSPPQNAPRDDSRPPPGATPPSATRPSAGLARQQFRIVESIDAGTGATAWVVTDGRDRAECSSQEFAARVRAALG